MKYSIETLKNKDLNILLYLLRKAQIRNAILTVFNILLGVSPFYCDEYWFLILIAIIWLILLTFFFINLIRFVRLNKVVDVKTEQLFKKYKES